MGYTTGIEITESLGIADAYVKETSAVFNDGVELSENLGVATRYLATGTKVFSDALALGDPLALATAYVADTGKVFTTGSNLLVTVRDFVDGDDSFEIIVGFYFDVDFYGVILSQGRW